MCGRSAISIKYVKYSSIGLSRMPKKRIVRSMSTPRKRATSKTARSTTQPELELEVIVEDLDEAMEVIPYTYSITAYGADYPVDSIVKRMNAADIIVPRFSWEPDKDSDIVGFQREYVWARPEGGPLHRVTSAGTSGARYFSCKGNHWSPSCPGWPSASIHPQIIL